MYYGYIIIAVLYSLVASIGLSIFIKERNRFPIATRSWELTSISVAFGIFHFNILFFDLAISEGPNGTPISCHELIWSSILFIPLWSGPYFYRSYHLMFQYHHQNEKEKGVEGFYHKYKVFLSTKFKLVACLVLAIVSILIGVIIYAATGEYENYTTTNPETSCVSPYVIFIIIQAASFFFLLIFMVVKLWKVEDSFYLKMELKAGLITCIPLFALWALAIMFDSITNYIKASWIVCFVIFTGFNLSIVFPIYLRFRSPAGANYFALKAQRSQTLEEMGVDQFQRCLLNEELYEEFKERAKKAWCVEAVIFCRAVLDFSQMCNENNKEEASAKAKDIYEKHIKQNSLLEINLEMSIKESIVEKIDAGEINIELFKRAYKSVYTTLKFGIFRDWSREPNFATNYARVTGLTTTDLTRSAVLTVVHNENE